VVCALFALSISAGSAFAGGLALTQTLPGPNPTGTDAFGTSVAMSDGTLAVGAPSDNGGAGAVLVYRQVAGGQWDLEQTLTNTCASGTLAGFGRSVAISGGTMVIGAPAASSQHAYGTAAVFTQANDGSWSCQELMFSTSVLDSQFGQSVAISGSSEAADTIAVGAPAQGCGYTNCGAVAIYTWNGTNAFVSDGPIQTPDVGASSEDDAFGASVAVSGQAVFVGEPYLQVSTSSDAGAVYEYTPAGSSADPWSSTTSSQLLAGTHASESAGIALAAQGGQLVIGAPGVGEVGVTGAVGEGLLYTVGSAGSTTAAGAFQPGYSSGTVNTEFGTTVAIDGSELVLGPLGSGFPCLFDTAGGSSTICAATTQISDGGGVAVSGATLAYGNPYAGATDEGAAYIYAQPAANVAVALSPSSIVADGSSTSTVTATITDAAGDPITADNVSFSASPTGVTIGSVTNHEDGTYTATITSSATAGQVTITASDTSASLSANATLSLTAAPSSGTPTTPTGSGTPTTPGGPGTAPPAPPATPSSSGPSAAQLLGSLSGLRAPKGKDATIKSILKSGDYPCSYKALEAGTVEVLWYAKVGRKEVLIAKGSARTTRAGTVSFKLKLTAAGRSLLKRDSHGVKVTFKTSFTPTGGKPTTLTGSFTLR
jgi:adhesin/invasin